MQIEAQPRKRGRPRKGQSVRNSDSQGLSLADLRLRLGALFTEAEKKGDVDNLVKLAAELRNLELAGLKVAPEAGRQNALQQFSDAELRAELERRGLVTTINVTFGAADAD